MRRVLFLCTGNSARSQMAEGLINHLLSHAWEASSAGTEPAQEVNAFAVQAMAELGIDIAAHRPKHVAELQGQAFDVVITLCDQAARSCPVWLGSGKVEHIGFADPAATTGTDEERLQVFRQVRDHIRCRVISYLDTLEPEAVE